MSIDSATPLRVIISGETCTGKTSLLRRLRDDQELQLAPIIPDATRGMRVGESEGSPYSFISQEEFQQRDQDGRYYYTLGLNGNFYGAKHEDVEKMRWSIDVLAQNVFRFKDLVGAVTIYLIPPSAEVLKARAIKRGDTEVSITKRMQNMLNPDPVVESFMYRVDAAQSEDTVYSQVKQIVQSHCKKI